jgi:hypothetical protein
LSRAAPLAAHKCADPHRWLGRIARNRKNYAESDAGTSFASNDGEPSYTQEKSMRRSYRTRAFVLAGVAVIALGAVGWQSRAASQRTVATGRAKAAVPKRRPKKPALAKFMREKLTASSQVLEGLCTEDYELIAKGAKRLKTMSSAEKWRVSNDAMYRQHSAEFRSGVDKLLKAANEKKIDSAALAWTKTTLNCIECHRWVKATLISGNPPNRPSLKAGNTSAN